MRIAIFTDTYLPDKNGVAMSIDHFTRLLADDGHQIVVYCPKSGRYKDKKYPNINVRRYASFSFPSYKDIKISTPFILSVTKDLKAFNPDIIHIQTPMAVGWIGIWAARILKKKSIQTYHTYIPDFLVYLQPKTLFGVNKLANYINNSRLIKELAEDDTSIENFDSAKLKLYLGNKIKDFTKKLSENKNTKFTDKFGKDYTRAVYERSKLVLTPSNAMRKILIKQGVRSRVEVLSNGINYDFFKKKEDYEIKKKMVYFGRLGYEKNVDVVIKAFDAALKKDADLRLDILGDGPARASLQNLAKELGIAKQVNFGGAYDIKKLSQQLHEYDFFVTASTIETQGIVILEAMASGLPVLGVDKLAVPEVVLDGKNGYLSKPGNVASMAKNMIKILEDPDRLKHFGKKSLAIAKSHEIMHCKDRLIGYYEQAIND